MLLEIKRHEKSEQCPLRTDENHPLSSRNARASQAKHRSRNDETGRRNMRNDYGVVVMSLFGLMSEEDDGDDDEIQSSLSRRQPGDGVMRVMCGNPCRPLHNCEIQFMKKQP